MVFRTVAVLGAGFLGSQIAAHLANADLDVLLFDLAVEGPEPARTVRQVIARLATLQPPPLACAEQIHSITPLTYQHNLQRLRECELVIEAVCENADCKQGLFARVAPYLASQTVLVTTTAGLGITALAAALPEPLRARFCGLQFFPPLRYRPLVELVAGVATDDRVLDELETFAVQVLGKGVVRAKDSPGFLVKRLLMVAQAIACWHAGRLGLAPAMVDELLRAAFGLRTAAVFAGSDQHGPTGFAESLIQLAGQLPDDPWLAALASMTATPAIDYQDEVSESAVANRSAGRQPPELPPAIKALLDPQHPAAMWAALQDSLLPGAQFLVAWLRDLLHYSAVCLATLAPSVRDIDLAARWGLGLRRGSFELWQALGWRRTAEQLRQAVADGVTLSVTAVPDWVFHVREVYNERGAYSPLNGRYLPSSPLAVYRRWLRPPGPAVGQPVRPQAVAFDLAGLRLRYSGDVAVLDLPAAPADFGGATLDALWEVLGIVRGNSQALVLYYPEAWGDDSPALLAELTAQSGRAARARWLERLQQVMLAVRQLPIPVVAAVQGRLAGPGFELAQHCDRIVAALESYLSPVAAQPVGLPLAGGSVAMVCRVAQVLGGPEGGTLIARYARLIGRAGLSSSALDARQLALLRPADPVVFNPCELLFVAQAQARALIDSGYRRMPERFCVAGAGGAQTVCQGLAYAHAAGEFTTPEYQRACRAATVLCGGQAGIGDWLGVVELLALEREAVLDLMETRSSTARV